MFCDGHATNIYADVCQLVVEEVNIEQEIVTFVVMFSMRQLMQFKESPYFAFEP